MGLTVGQQRCVDILDRPLVVAAGAGSGKTFTLTKRIVSALESGFVQDIGEVCAITFTKKAAGELKSRIKAELRARGLLEQAARADEAWVSTIHGMCARILRAHALELGIDPAFSVVEGAAVDEYLARALDVTLAEARRSPEAERVNALFDEYEARSYGAASASVEGMLGQLVALAATQPAQVDAFVLPGTVLNPQLTLDQALEVVDALVAAAQNEKPSAKRDAWLEQALDAIDAMRDLALQPECDYASVLGVIGALKLAKNFGSKDYRKLVDDAKARLGACVMEARLGAAKPHLETLLMLARRSLDVFTQLKRADGVLDNADLLVWAARAMEDHPEIAANYEHKFKLVMVDEFQDTDQMQVDMIKRLSGEGACHLCTVGDAQQSIYRFRGADVSVYRRHLDAVRGASSGEVIELSDNFRSHGDVLSFVDRVFEKPDMFGGSFMPLAPLRDETRVREPFEADRPRVIVQHTSAPWRGVSAEAVTLESARRVAAAFAELARAGHSAGEMVVLLGRMKNAGVFARALREQGLACVIAGGSVFSQTQEAQVMLELVRALANPAESQSLFNVLTSPLFGLSAGDLLDVGRGRKFWLAFARSLLETGRGESLEDGVAPEAPSPQLACALRVMAQARAKVGNASVADIIADVVVDAGWLSRLEAQGPEGLASAANVLKAIRVVRGIERDGAFDVSSTARAFADALAHSKEAPGALAVTGGDSVRIMTIHASKGLEFPIVAVAEMKSGRSAWSPLMVSTVGGRPYVSLDLGKSASDAGNSVDADTRQLIADYVLGELAGEDELAEAVAADAGALHRRLAMGAYEDVAESDEAKRLLYVALTRAKEALVVATVGKRTKDNPDGIPNNAFSGVASALGSLEGSFAAGSTRWPFGGTHDAVVEHVALEADETPQADGPLDGEEIAVGLSAERSLFAVPGETPRVRTALERFNPLRENTFSYSSIAEGTHGTPLLEQLADRYAVCVDEAAQRDEFVTPAVPFVSRRPVAPVTFGDDDVDAFDVSAAFDEDRATDLGTAFHRLAQYAVKKRRAPEALVTPEPVRVDALARTCGLDLIQRKRLDAALARWFGSDLARDMAVFPDLRAEVPFFISLPQASDDGGPALHLEGEIDLFAVDESGLDVRLVDYKTGGHADEPDEELRCKHVLQATCYAYAVLLQGYRSVEAVFARVEQARADDEAQPQCVRYRFDASDVDDLARAIAQAYAQSASA